MSSHSTSRRAFMAQIAAGGTVLGTGAAAGAALPDLSEAAFGAELPLPGPGQAPDDDAYWRMVREQFLVAPEITYLNTGTRGPSPRSVVAAQFDAIRAYDRDRLTYARTAASNDAREALRTRLATFIGCKPNEVAMTCNTTEGMSIGTAGLDLKAGDEIIYTNHDHNGGAMPINLRAARHGIVPRMVDLSGSEFHPPSSADALVSAIEAAITPRTRLISFCHVNYTDGCVMPVKEICALARSRGILTLVDGAHPPGMMQMNLRDLGCDMYAGAGHKWLLASMFTGFLFVREDLQDRVWPLNYSGPVLGMSMYGEPQPPGSSLDRSRTAARYETHGSRHYASEASLGAALDFQAALTPAAIEARVRHMTNQARSRLRNIPGVRVHVSDDPALSCGLVSFNVGDLDPIKVNDALWNRHQIYIRDVTHKEIGWAVNRASLHIMAHDGEVERFIGAVEELAREHHA